jgi:hypothetical protein
MNQNLVCPRNFWEERGNEYLGNNFNVSELKYVDRSSEKIYENCVVKVKLSM